MRIPVKRALASVAFVLAVAGCASVSGSVDAPMTPLSRYSLQVEPGLDRIALAVHDHGLSSNQHAALRDLAARYGAEVMRLAELPDRLHEFDAVISCTASTLPLIGLGAVERALKKRKHRPMFMVDLAVPRDIEPEVKALEDVYLYTVDDLASVVQAGQAQRQAAVAQAEVIIDAGVQSFSHWLEQRDAVPLIQQLHSQADSWRDAELVRARKLLAKGDDPDAVLEALAKGLSQKMLHGTLTELRSANPAHREQAMQVVQRLCSRQER